MLASLWSRRTSNEAAAGHASATASLKLTFHLDHSVGANHLLHAVARKVFDDVRIDCPSRCDVGIATGRVALLELGKSASVERACQLRVELQRLIIIVDGRAPLSHLEVGQPARIECGGDVRL